MNCKKNGRWEDLKEHVGTHKRKYVVALILALAVAVVKSKQRRELTKAVVNTTSISKKAGPPEAPPTAAPASTPPSPSHTDTRVLQPGESAIDVGPSFYWPTFASAEPWQDIPTTRVDTKEKIFIVGSASPLNDDGSLNVQVRFFQGDRRHNARIYRKGFSVMLERRPGNN